MPPRPLAKRPVMQKRRRLSKTLKQRRYPLYDLE